MRTDSIKRTAFCLADRTERQQQLEPWTRNTCSYYTVKKGYPFSCPQSLVSDIPAGDGKTANRFLQCIIFLPSVRVLESSPKSPSPSSTKNPSLIPLKTSGKKTATLQFKYCYRN